MSAGHNGLKIFERAVLGAAVLMGATACGHNVSADKPSGMPTERPTDSSASAPWDSTNPNTMPTSSVTVNPDGTASYTPPSTPEQAPATGQTMECGGHTYMIPALGNVAIKTSKLAVVEAVSGQNPPFSISWQCLENVENTAGTLTSSPYVVFTGTGGDGSPTRLSEAWADNFPEQPVLVK